MSSEKTHAGWRLLWAAVGGALTFVVASASLPDLALVGLVGMTVAAAAASAVLGPLVLEFLGLL